MHARVDCPQWVWGVMVAGLCVSTATTLSAGEGGRASGGMGAEADTMDGRVVTEHISPS